MFQTLNPQILLFRKTSDWRNPFGEQLQKHEDETDFSRLRCPLCKWQPSRFSLWECADCGDPEYFFGGCGMPWNTFETGGKCPGCNYQWRYTSCLRCGGWSPHEAWYGKTENQP